MIALATKLKVGPMTFGGQYVTVGNAPGGIA
jgi:hypothetical protein